MSNDATTSRMNRDERVPRFILVVDSNAQGFSYTSLLLQRFNYQVFKAASGREALDTAATALPFLIIMSLHLPDMHGFDLCTAGSGPHQEQGVGLQFVRIAPNDQEHIRRFIRNEVMRDITSRQG